MSNAWHGRWDQRAVERREMGGHNMSAVRRIPSQAESINSFEFDQLRDSVTDLSQERRPVQHPLENENGVSEQVEDSYGNAYRDHYYDDDEFNPIECSFVTSYNSGLSQGVGNPPLPAQNHGPAMYQQQPIMERNIHQSHQLQQQLRGLSIHPAGMVQPCACSVQQSVPSQHYYPGPHQNGYHIPHQQTALHPSMCSSQAAHAIPAQRSQSVNSNQQQQHHLVDRHNGAVPGRVSPDIGLQESLIGIAAPAPVPNKRPTPAVNDEDHFLPSSSDNLYEEDSQDSLNSNLSFHTMHPSYEKGLKNEERNPVLARQQNNIPTVSKQVSSNDSTPKTASTQPYNSPPPTPGIGSAPGASPQPIKEKVKVFVTYAQEPQNPDHIRTVVQISQTLFKNSFDVTVDVLEETVRSMSISDWLETNISNSDFVLICVSPGYRAVVDGNASVATSGFHQKENAVNTQYIHRRIHNEYISNGSKNFRFLPVLVSGAAVTHIPPWLRDTKAYQWPKDYEDIIYRLFRQERYVKPQPGPPPVHTIERYDSCSSRRTSKDSDKGPQTKPKHVG